MRLEIEQWAGSFQSSQLPGVWTGCDASRTACKNGLPLQFLRHLLRRQGSFSFYALLHGCTLIQDYIYIYTVLYSIYIFRTAWTTEYLERTPGSRGPMLMRRRYNYWELKWIWKVENTSIVKIGMQIGECLASVDVQRIFWRLLRISWLGMVYDCVKCRVKAKCIAAKQTQERLPLWHIYICLLWGDPRRS